MNLNKFTISLPVLSSYFFYMLIDLICLRPAYKIWVAIILKEKK